MESVGLTITILVLFVSQCFADTCRTCRGSDCSQKDVLQVNCNKYVPALPFESQISSQKNVENLQYGCLDLEYYNEKRVDKLQQCILTSDPTSFCDNLSKNLEVVRCHVQSLTNSRQVRSYVDNLAEDPDTKSSAPGSSTDSTGSSTDSTGSSSDSTGSSTDSTGSSTDSTGSTTDSTGSSTDSTGSSTDSTGSSSVDPGSTTPGTNAGTMHVLSFMSFAGILIISLL